MSKDVEEIDLSAISTSARLALLEEFNEDTVVEEIEDSSGKDTDSPTVESGDGPDEDLLDGIRSEVTETEDDPNETEERVERQTLFFFKLEDIQRKGHFRPDNPKVGDKGFPLQSSGQIESITIIAGSSNFSTFVQVDDDKVLDDEDWSYINDISQELPHIGAYRRTDDDYVLSISDYPFNREIDFSIEAKEEISFTLIRVEIMLDEYTTGEN